MLRKIYDRVREFMVMFDNEPGGGLHDRFQDARDFVLGAVFSYTPKNTRTNNASKILSYRNQKRQNTCVAESGSAQKEVDEGVVLSEQMIATYLRKQGLMSATGASLSSLQNAVKNVGICQARLTPNNHDVSWDEFSDYRILTNEVMDDAGKHKSGSYFVTYDLDKVLEQIDNGRLGQTGSRWYSGYNMSGGLKYPYILTLGSGIYRADHATVIVDYDLDYHGYSVLKVLNSYSEAYGDKGYYYVKFSDFKDMFGKYGVYYNTDLPKSIAGWTSINNGRAVKEIAGPKVYILDGGKKRHIPDEAIMWMLGITPQQIVIDEDNFLPQVPEGEPIGVKEFTAQEMDKVRYFVAMQKDDNFMKNRFSKYFPELFIK